MDDKGIMMLKIRVQVFNLGVLGCIVSRFVTYESQL